MNTAEIVIREMQGDGGFQMRQLFAERIREPRKAPKLHSHGQVLPFYKAGRNMLRIGIASSDLGYRPRDTWWGVPPVAVELPVIPEHLGKLGEVGIRSKARGNAFGVVDEAIGRDLSSALDSVVQIGKELGHVALEPLPDVERRNQLGFRVNRHKHPLAAELRRITATNVALFLADKRPDFVQLQIPGPDVANLSVHESGAALASDQQKAHDSVAVESSQSLRAADRATFQKALQRPCRVLRAGTHRSKGRSGLGFREGCTTGIATPALDSTLAVGSESLAGLVLTSEAGHVISPLAFCEETSQNRFSRSMAWVTPRCGLAPTPAETEAGAYYVRVYPLGWYDGYFHRWTVSSEAYCDYDLHCAVPFPYRSVLISLSGLYLFLNFLVLGELNPIGQATGAVCRPCPSVGGLAANRAVFAHLTLLLEPSYHGDDRCLQVAVLSRIETTALQQPFHILCSYLTTSFLQYAPDHVRQSHRFFLIKIFSGKFGEGRNGLPKIGKAQLYVLQSPLNSTLLGDQGSEFVLRHFESGFVGFRAHTRIISW
jgi:hypothetical protein